MNPLLKPAFTPVFALFLFWSASLADSRAQERSFVGGSRTQLGTESNLSASVRSGDLDGDGDIDVVVANGRHWAQQNYVFLNDGRGHFNVMRPLGTDHSTTYACEIDDLDADGDLDIVTGNAMAPCNVFLNQGNAKFTLHSSLNEISSVRSIALARFDGNASPDVLVTCRGRPNIIFFNDGKAGFDKKRPFGSKSDSTIDVAVADFDMDHVADLMLANRDDQHNFLLLNSGPTQFKKLPMGFAVQNSRAVIAEDFNGDGVLDAMFGNIGEPNSVFLATKLGHFGRGLPVGPNGKQTYAIAAADMDRDGDIDFVEGNVQARNAVYFNQGNGKDFARIEFGSPTTATYGVCIADFDGDSYPDIAVANSGDVNTVFMSRPSRSGRPSSPQQSQPKPKTPPSKRTQSSITELAEPKTSDWPMFRGKGAQGVSYGFELPEKWDVPAGEQVLWRQKVPGLGHSSPVIVGDRIFVATAIAEAGSAPLQTGRSGAPTAADDNGKQSWRVICYDKKTGKEIWNKEAHAGIPRATRHAKATHASSTVTVYGDNVVAFFGSEGLYCYDLEGNLKWKRDLGVVNISKYGIGWGYASSPAVGNDRIVLVCDDPDNPYAVTLDLKTGEEVWRVSRKGDCERSWGTPLIYKASDSEDTQVVINGWPSVISYDLADGSELWRIRGGGDNPIPTPFVANGHIFVTSAHGADSPIHAIVPTARGDITAKAKDAPNDSFLWSVPRGGSYMSTPVVYGNYIYLGNSNGVLRCFHSKTGEKIYEKRLGSGAGIIASLIAGDDKIYCASENGNVYVVAAGPEYENLAVNPMTKPCFASPAMSEGVLFFRTTEELIAIQ